MQSRDPLHPENRELTYYMVRNAKQDKPDKSICLHTDYSWEEIISSPFLLATIRFVDFIADWQGTTVIDVQKSLKTGEMTPAERRLTDDGTY